MSALVVGIQVVVGVAFDVVPNHLLQVDVYVVDIDHSVVLPTARSASSHPPCEIDELVPVLARP